MNKLSHKNFSNGKKKCFLEKANIYLDSNKVFEDIFSFNDTSDFTISENFSIEVKEHNSLTIRGDIQGIISAGGNNVYYIQYNFSLIGFKYKGLSYTIPSKFATSEEEFTKFLSRLTPKLNLFKNHGPGGYDMYPDKLTGYLRFLKASDDKISFLNLTGYPPMFKITNLECSVYVPQVINASSKVDGNFKMDLELVPPVDYSHDEKNMYIHDPFYNQFGGYTSVSIDSYYNNIIFSSSYYKANSGGYIPVKGLAQPAYVYLQYNKYEYSNIPNSTKKIEFDCICNNKNFVFENKESFIDTLIERSKNELEMGSYSLDFNKTDGNYIDQVNFFLLTDFLDHLKYNSSYYKFKLDLSYINI